MRPKNALDFHCVFFFAAFLFFLLLSATFCLIFARWCVVPRLLVSSRAPSVFRRHEKIGAVYFSVCEAWLTRMTEGAKLRT